MADDDKNGKNGKRPLSRAEKFKNYCLGIGALTGIVIGLLAHFKGEPEAKEAKVEAGEASAKAVKAYETVTKQMNEVIKAQRKLHLRMVHIQAHDEGYRAAQLMLRLQEENEQLRKQLPAWKRKKLSGAGAGGVDTLVGPAYAAKPVKPTTKAPPKPAKPKPKACPPGWVRTGNRCRAVPRAVAKVVTRAREELREAKRKARLEGLKRQALEQKMKAQQDVEIPKPLPPKFPGGSLKRTTK